MSTELQGFKHLLGSNSLESPVNVSQHTHQIVFLPTEKLHPGKYQPRTVFDDESLSELSKSITSNGIVQPLLARRVWEDNREFYEIIAGERRWRAAKLAGLEKVPVIIQDIKDDTALAISLIENIQREDLNLMDKIVAMERLRTEFSMGHNEIAETVGLSRPTVSNLLRLLDLPDEIQSMLRVGQLEMGHARALLSLELSDQLAIAYETINRQLSVRAVESLIQQMRQLPSQKPNIDVTWDSKVKDYQQTLSSLLRTSSVALTLNKKGQGRVVISIKTLEEIEALIDHIKLKTSSN